MRSLIDIWRSSAWSIRLSILFWIILLLVAIGAPILSLILGYGPNDIASDSVIYQSPGTVDAHGIHWLGTDRLGQDVLLRLIYGARTALLIGAGATIISMLIAGILGIISGYMGDDRYRISIAQLLWAIFYFPLLFFYQNEFGWSWLIIILGIVLGVAISRYIGQHTHRRITVWSDTLIIKVIEIYTTIPGLLLVFSLFAIIGQTSIWSVIIILGLMSWAGKTRLLRAEIMQLKTQNYIKAAHLMGMPRWQIILRHLLPNALPPLLVAVIFSFAGTILTESTLSFLDLGLPTTVPSWGGIMRDAREYFSAWWLAVFPGIMLFLTVLTLNVLATQISDTSGR